MCGIAGWLGTTGLHGPGDATIRWMLDRIAHRGPDGRGTALLPEGNGMLGHVRLAIIDPAGGAQPLWSRDGRSVLVFNGEIYNFRDLRRRLGFDAGDWRTNSDTEVVLELLLRDGPATLGLLRGMYAFAFWDGRRQRALLARDPNGIKPLFVREAGGTLWFASEAKAFPRTPDWQPTLGADRLHLLLNLRYPAEGAGLMRGVRQLAPGEVLEWTPRGLRRSAITLPPVVEVGEDGVRAAVLDSVDAHLVADVPVATYLSGGVDSGIVTYGAARARPGTLETFTIDAGDDPREARHAAESARWLGVPNHVASLSKVGPEAVRWLLWHLEVPKVNALQSAAVAQFASRRFKVCLSGLGGDELFLGYRAHHHLALANRASAGLGPLAGPLGRTLAAAASMIGEFSEPSRVARMLAMGRDAAGTYALLRNVWDGALQRERVYGPRMLDERLVDVREWVRDRWPAQPTAVTAMADFEWRNKMTDDLLWQEDRTSMAFGLEVRVPFVDQHLRAALRSLVPGFARRPGSKQALKDAFRADLPDWLLRRPKSGFQLDIASQVDPLFGEILESWLSPERVRQHALFNEKFVRDLLGLRRTRAHRWHLFMLLLMAQAHLWVDLFESAEPAPARPPEFTIGTR